MAKISENIITVGDIKYALKNLDDDMQVYLLDKEYYSLIDITEIIQILPKKRDDKPYVAFFT